MPLCPFQGQALYFACLYGNSENDFLRRYMERDYELEQQLILEELDFWQNYVQKKDLPAIRR